MPDEAMAPGGHDGPRRRIIVVDDDRETRELLQILLELEGFEVKLAANGLRLISTLHVDRPDAILLDVMMSWIDGFELCRAIKRNPEFKDIPVFFISGRTEPADVSRGMEVGAAGYFPKPIDTARLITTLAGIGAAGARASHLPGGPPGGEASGAAR
jgi:CheY-like chemotaxis protein